MLVPKVKEYERLITISVSEAPTLVTVLLEISTKLYVIEESAPSLMTRSFSEDIAKHKKRFQSNKEKYTDNMERLLKWKAALTQTANLSGYHFNFRNEYEYEIIPTSKTWTNSNNLSFLIHENETTTINLIACMSSTQQNKISLLSQTMRVD
ncbi:hypothetical protein P8452_51511 [Trifolium repens]|nr:hypothetical protein P8452_51511 [Trifolium repens]